MFGGDPPYALRDLCRNCEADLVILCGSSDLKKCFEDEAGQKWMENALLSEVLACVLDVTGKDAVVDQKTISIQEYLDSHEHKEYVIIDYEELEPVFPGHTVYLSGMFDKSAAKKAERILLYPPYGENLQRYDPSGSMSDLIEDYIEKAIFLDIDGVLNDDGKRVYNGESICPEYVENLAWIVEQTGAELILSSSWRYGMIRRSQGDGERKIQVLLDEFAKYHLRIAGITPLYFNGPQGRPYEVRSWLAYRPALESFVILDDDDFWNWQWMSDRFVRTAREAVNTKKPSRWRYEKGLDREFAQRAVEILNR